MEEIMKTKRLAVAAMVTVIMFTLYGCGSVKSTLVMKPDGEVVYENAGYGRLGADARSLASAKVSEAQADKIRSEAYRIRKQADAMTAMLTGQQIGEKTEGGAVVAKKGYYLLGFVNNDPKVTGYTYHPEQPGVKIMLNPGGGFAFMEVRDIPYDIVIYRESDNQIAKTITPRYDYLYAEKMSHKKAVGKALVDLKFTIDKFN